MKWIASAAIAVVAMLAIGSVAAANGVGEPSIYFDGELYRTVGTPTDFSNAGAPDHSFDTIYDLSECQANNVSDGAPGDTDFNGGRWKVVPVHFLIGCEELVGTYDTNGSGDIDSEGELHAVLAAGDAELQAVAKYFECPMIPAPGNE